MRSVLAALILLLAGATAQAQDPAATRGRLLYGNHCIECHTAQMHWRNARLARDWSTLVAQVQRWQGEARLGWTEEDVDAVARHLNETIYHFPQPAPVARGR